MVNWDEWAARSDTVKVFLVETSAVRLSDGAVAQLFLSKNRAPKFPDRQYLDCVTGLPRLTRQANDTLNPNHIPTQGELEVRIDRDRKPNTECSISWGELLSSDWNLRGQPLTILLGGEGFAYADFKPVFSGGRVGKYNWTDATLTLAIRDRAEDLNKKLPDYELPESPRVQADCWDAAVSLVLGVANNYKPTLINTANPGAYPWKYALACHVVEALVHTYYNNSLLNVADLLFTQKDLLPAGKDGEGSAVLDIFGPYTGSLVAAEWLIEIDSIAAGTAVGLATFRYSIDGGLTWEAAGQLTWKLAYDSATKSPSVGNGTATISGTYTGTEKLQYLIKISRNGNIGDVIPPQFVWSETGGAAWSAPIDILDTDPIALSNGLSVAFDGATGFWTQVVSWHPTGGALGVMTVPAHNDGDVVDVVITMGGEPGDGTIKFKWTKDGGLNWTENVDIPDNNPIELFAGYSVQFSTNPPSYYSGDYGGSVSFWTDAFVVDDLWTLALKEIPIPLADGVAIQFIDRATALAQGVDELRFLSSPDDFALGDNWRFILGSTLAIAVQVPIGTITVDVLGLVTPAVGYTDKIGEMIRALPQGWRGWEDADFDLPALAAFNAAIPYQAGLVVFSPTEIAEIIDQLLAGIPALYTLNQAGKFYLAEVTPVTAEPVLELTDVEFLQSPEGSDGDDSLYRRVYLHYDRNYNSENNPQNAPNLERLAWLSQEWRQVSARDETVLARYPWAGDLGPLDTCLVLRDDAKTLAAKLLALYKEKHPPLEVITKIQPFRLDLWKDVVGVRRSRFGELVTTGFAIMGMELDFTAFEATLTLWK